jgi:ferrous iron transport protein B
MSTAPVLTPAPTTEIRVALAGNPNAGKSTLFNALTGSQQHVGNWPGKTVEKKTGVHQAGGTQLLITDLPGAYSLSTYSQEEVVTRDFILDAQPDVLVAVADATNLERNLYFIVQLLELGRPMVVVLNMMDMAERKGLTIDLAVLSDALGVPVLTAVARKGIGLDELVAVVRQTADAEANDFALDYGPAIEGELAALGAELAAHPDVTARFPGRWPALKLLEDDADVAERLAAIPDGDACLEAADAARERLRLTLPDDVDAMTADRRYTVIHQLVGSVVTQPGAEQPSLSDRVDRVVMHRWLGIPIFLAVMWLTFRLTADVSAPLVDWLNYVINGPVANWTVAILGTVGLADTWLASLLVDGVLAGVGGVLVFMPVLLVLYLALAVLEDSGYMARAAFVMDRLMNRIGLHGRSFLPLMVGFGCSVPAIYATRTLDNQRDRILTGLLVPFMSCGARLPVYVLFAAIFFPQRGGAVIFGLYLLGIVVALGVGLLLWRTVLPATRSHGLVMELPPYRLPHWQSIWYQMWQRTRSFLAHAWSIILIMSLVIWFLMAVPLGGSGTFAAAPLPESAFGRLSNALSPVFQPLGFGSWETTGALVSGLVAKEVVVSTLAQTYDTAPSRDGDAPTTLGQDALDIVTSFATAVGDTLRAIPSLVGINLQRDTGDEADSALSAQIQAGFTASSNGHATLAALAFLVFVLLYTPCVATAAAERHELGTRWMWTSLIGQFVLAWVAALIVFQGGLLLGVG